MSCGPSKTHAHLFLTALLTLLTLAFEGSSGDLHAGLAAVVEAVEKVSAKVDATSGELRAEIEALRLAQETDDFSFVSPTGKQ